MIDCGYVGRALTIANTSGFVVLRSIEFRGGRAPLGMTARLAASDPPLDLGGGAIVMQNVSNVLMDDVGFTNNLCQSACWGGAVAVDASSTSLTLTGCRFVNNSVSPNRTAAGNATTSNGGGAVALVLRGDSYVEFHRTTFQYNSAESVTTSTRGGGGALAIRGTDSTIVNVTGCTFNSNVLKGTSSVSAGSGAAFVAELHGWTHLWVDNSVFVDNTVERGTAGGAAAIWMQDSATSNITRSQFHGNSMNGVSVSETLRGGVLSVFVDGSSSLAITLCNFTNNTSLYQGGALFVRGAQTSTIMLADSVFMYNRALIYGTSGTGGGGAYVTLAGTISATVYNCQFTNNAASWLGSDPASAPAVGGGGLWVEAYVAVQLNVRQCVFDSNNVTAAPLDGRAGGFVLLTYAGSHHIADCVFHNNEWGGLWVYLVEHPPVVVTLDTVPLLSVERCTFTNNTTPSFGGAGLFLAGDESNISLNYTCVTSTGAYGTGKEQCDISNSPIRFAEYIGVPVVALSDCSFIGNHATALASSGGGLLVVHIHMRISRCIFSQNSAGFFGGSIGIAGASSGFTMRHSVLEGGTASSGGSNLYIRTSADLLLHNVTIHMGNTLSDVFIPTAQRINVLPPTLFACPTGAVVSYRPIPPYLDTDVFRVTSITMGCTSCPSQMYVLAPSYLRVEQPDHNVFISNATKVVPSCEVCAYGSRCVSNDEQGGATEVQSLGGFWGYRGDEADVYNLHFASCPLGYCSSTPSSWETSCAPHRTGRLCGECAHGYSQSIGGSRCIVDVDCNDSGWFWFVSLLFASVFVVWTAWSSRRTDSGAVAAVIFFYQVRLRSTSKCV